MNFVTIAKYRILQYVRDIQSLLFMLLVPIVLILILGNALAKNDSFTAKNIDKVKVIYINNGSEKNKENFQSFIEDDYLKDIIIPTEIMSEIEGKILIENRKYDALIIYDDRLESKIQVVGSDYNSLGVSIIKNLVDTYSSTANTFEALQKIKAKNYSFINTKTNVIEDRSISVLGKKPSAIDYYTITMLVMTIMYGSIYANFAIDMAYYSKVGDRLKIAPVRLWEFFLGEGIGVIFTLMWQVLVLLVVARYAFNVNFGNSLLVIVLTTFSLATMSTMLGMFACMVTKKGMIGLALLNILVPILTFLSGGFVKINFSGVLGKIASITPNYLAQNAIFKQIYGGATDEVYLSILGIWVVTLLLFIGARLVSRREIA